MTKMIQRPRTPMVAIVGRANVGKSTLWNKIVERRRAITSRRPHTTRDRNIAPALWRGREFLIVDTGGMDVEKDEIGAGITRQVARALDETDVIVFVIDGKTGVVADDRKFAKSVRHMKKPVILAVNKIDAMKDLGESRSKEMYGLGLGEPLSVSAATGSGVGDLLDEIFSMLGDRMNGPESPDDEASKDDELQPLKLVIMGRPNVGKSSLVNAILEEERVIVSPIAHTTREPQDTELTYKDREITLVDTAGMRKRANVSRGLEEESIKRNRDALTHADIALLVFDATEPIGHQDKHLAGLMQKSEKGLILVANKWDLVEDKTTGSAKEYETTIRAQFPFLNWAPMIFISAKTGKRARGVLDFALDIEKERHRKITYNALNKLLKSVIRQKKPLAVLGPKSPHVYDIMQTDTEPPRFRVTIVGEKRTVHASWLKFLERRIRDKFGFYGTPIVVQSSNVPASKHARRIRAAESSP